LKLVESGRIARGSYLVIENLDRLSREHIQAALQLLLGLLQNGIRVVQLKPAEMVFDETSDAMPVMMAIMELQRGHGESLIKSQRVGQAWAQKKERARRGEPQPENKSGRTSGMALMTHKLPAWIEERGGKMRLIPERGAVVKRIYKLAAAGYSATAISKRFKAEGIPPMGRSNVWVRSYISHILSDRRPVGDYQPKNRRQQPEGEPIRGYFPPCVTEAEWNAAKGALSARQFPPSRIMDYVYLFSGLLRDARDGTSYYRQVAGNGRAHDALVNRCQDSDMPNRSFPLETLEDAILSKLREIDPMEILSDGDQTAPDETAALAGELAGVEMKIGELEGELLTGPVATIAKVLRGLEEKKRDLTAKLTELRQKQAHPLDESWTQTQSLLAAIKGAKDVTDTRIRLRSALRRIVESMTMLIVPRGMTRLAAVQIRFVGGDRRDYLIVHRGGHSNGNAKREASWRVRDAAWTSPKDKSKGRKSAEFDLRNKDDVAALEQLLTDIPIETLMSNT
jgi:hypothetical protein